MLPLLQLFYQIGLTNLLKHNYLGYLGINSPKYKILAQRISEDNNIIFAIKKKGDKNIYTKTANEILAAALHLGKKSTFLSFNR